MADYQIKISAVDNATPVVDKAFKKTQSSATSVSGKIGDRFRDVFENVTQNATGAFGSVAGGLFKLPGPAGIAAAAILAIGGAAVASAKKYAEANAANDTASAQFLANLDKLKGSFSGLVNTIGGAAVGAFNALAEAFGTAATAQEVLLRQEKAYNELIVKQVSDTDAYVKKLNEILDADKRLLETGIIKDYFDAFAQGNTKLANIYADQLRRLRLQEGLQKSIIELQKKPVDAKTDGGFKLELDAAKRLGQEILNTFKDIEDQNRKSTIAGIAAMDAALAKDQQAFAQENANNAARTAAALAYSRLRQEQLDAEYQATVAIGQAINMQIAQGLAAGLLAGEKLNIILGNILKQLANRALTNLIFKGLGAIFPGAGLTGGIFKGLFGRRAEIPASIPSIGSSSVQRVAPVSISPTTTAGAAINLNVVINGSTMNEDRLVRTLNKYVKQGGRLLASQVAN